MLKVLQKTLDLLSANERKRALMLLGMMCVMATLDTLGVASIMPFVAVISNPQLLETNTLLAHFYGVSSYYGVKTPDQFLYVLGVLVFILLIGSLAFKAFTTYMVLRFSLLREFSISKRLVEGYLCQPFAWFLNRNGADLAKNILSEVSLVIHQGLIPLMNLISQGLVAIALIVLILVVDYKLALIVGVTLTGSYAFIFKISKSFLTQIGAERLNANQDRFTTLNEAFGGVKEIKLSGLERTYIQRFSKSAEIYALNQAAAQVVSQVPRFALEAIAFGGLLLLMLYLTYWQGVGFASVLPVISLYAFAGYRLMPALQHIYSSLSQISFTTPALESLHLELLNLEHSKTTSLPSAMALYQNIELDGIVYRYPNASEPALKGVSLSISAKSTVGFVGVTGSGKTTIVDVILGLLDVEEGSLSIDGQVIDRDNKRAWQRTIGYVPQHIYLADSTVAENIAFGVEPDQIDQAALERATKIAKLHDFVVDNLPQGYATIVGERGVRLSGGQRQRIGIARALYHNPSVLILDEATSALDNITEQAVMEAVNNMGHEITIILIAHRLSTVKVCDTIFLLEKGELKAQGSYAELNESNQKFQEMTGGVK